MITANILVHWLLGDITGVIHMAAIIPTYKLANWIILLLFNYENL